MPRLQSTLRLLVALSLVAQPAYAQDVPYFRFQVGKDGQANGLRFASADRIADGVVGTPASANFSVAGGKGPYRMDLVDAPPGLSINKVSDTTWNVTGTLTPAGAFTSAIVRLTDAMDTSVSQAIPVTVIDPGVASEIQLSFGNAERIPDGVVGTAVRTTYVPKGGKPPYKVTLSGAPSGLSIGTTDNKTWTVTGTLNPAGTYPGGLVSLTDADNRTPVTYSVPVTVTDPGTPQASLDFASGDPLPNGRVGTRVRGYYQATGGKAPYAMTLVAAPAGVVLTKVSDDTWTASGAFNEAGDFPSALVRLTDSATPAGVTYPVPVTVDAAPMLSFTYGTNFPDSFVANSTQVAYFGITGGVEPMKWEIASAPTTVIATGDKNSGYAIGAVDTPGTYTGATLKVTDAIGQVATKALRDFTVTESTSEKLQVSGLQQLPATIHAGERFEISGIQVQGTSGGHRAYASVYGAGGNQAASVFQSGDDGVDPVVMQGVFAPTQADAGKTYDVSVMFMDAGNTNNTVIVPWGKTTVVLDPIQVTKNFDSLYKGKSGTTQTAFAKVRGGTGLYDVSMDQPAGSNLYAYTVDCSGYYADCSPYGITNGEKPIETRIAFAAPGVTRPYRVVVTDRGTGERAFLPAFALESEKGPAMTKISEFPPQVTVDTSPYGYASLPSSYAKVANGSSLVTVDYTAQGDGPTNVFGAWNSCDDPSGYACSQAGSAKGENLIALNGSLPAEGQVVVTVTATDPSSSSQVVFDPFTVTINPPALGSCRFRPVKALQGTASTTKDAIAFTGGRGPFAIDVSDATDISVGSPRTLRSAGRSADVVVGAAATGTSMHVKVTDSTGASCEGDAPVNVYPASSGDEIDVVAVRTGSYGYSTSVFLTPDSQSPVFRLNVSAEDLTGLAEGPQGVHPNTEGVLLGFVPPDGLSVTGFSVAAVDTPVGYLPLLGSDQYGYRDPALVFLQNLHLTNSETHFVPGDYRYSFNVFLSDGTYRVSKLISIRMD